MNRIVVLAVFFVSSFSSIAHSQPNNIDIQECKIFGFYPGMTGVERDALYKKYGVIQKVSCLTPEEWKKRCFYCDDPEKYYKDACQSMLDKISLSKDEVVIITNNKYNSGDALADDISNECGVKMHAITYPYPVSYFLGCDKGYSYVDNKNGCQINICDNMGVDITTIETKQQTKQ